MLFVESILFVVRYHVHFGNRTAKVSFGIDLELNSTEFHQEFRGLGVGLLVDCRNPQAFVVSNLGI